MALAGVLTLGLSCTDGPTEPAPVASITVTPPSLTLASGATATLSAVTADASGAALPGRPVTWSSSDAGVATVSAGGVVTAGLNRGGAPVTVTITAQSEGRTGAAAVQITPVPVARVVVTPDSLAVSPGASLALTYGVADANGAPLAGRTAVWLSLDTTVARVDGQGRITAAVYLGPDVRRTAVIVTVEGKSDTAAIIIPPIAVATVTVSPDSLALPVGGARPLTTVVRDAAGVILTGRPISFLTRDSTVVTVSPSGMVTAIPYTGPQARSTTVIATVSGRADTAVVVATPTPVASIHLTTAAETLAVGATQRISAVTKDSSGTILTGRTITWVSSDTGVATVETSGSGDGDVTAVAYADTAMRVVTIIATTEGRSAAVLLRVTPAAVAQVRIASDSLVLAHGRSGALSVTVRDGAGRPLDSRPVAWRSLDSLLASVDLRGVVLTFAERPWLRQETSIIAQVGTMADTTAVIVTPWALRATPPSGTVSTLPLVHQPWAPRPPTVLEGVVQYGDGAGGNLLGCDAFVPGSLVGKAVVVDRGTCAFSLKAENIGRAGAVLAILRESTTGIPPFASAFGGGVVSVPTFMIAGGDGDRLITGPANTVLRVDPAVGFSTTPDAVAWVTLTTSTNSIGVGATQQLTAALSNRSGTTLAGRSVTWATSDPTVASVSASGLVTAAPYAGGVVRRAVISASSEGRTGQLPVIVTPIPVASVTLSPATATIAVGATQQLSVVIRDAVGGLLSGRSVTWSSADTNKATVSGTGLVSARAASQVSITATSEGRSATTVLTILPENPCAPAGAYLLMLPESVVASISGADCGWTPPANASQNDRFDLYRFTLTARTAVTIDMSRGSLPNPYLFLLNAVSGDSIAANDDAQPGVADARIARTLEPGSYLIRATGFGPSERGTYTLRLAGCRVGLVVGSRLQAGDGQRAAPGSAVPIAPAIAVLDECGNGVAGVPVTFATVADVGSITGAIATTDATGVATLGRWSLAAGPNVLSATIGGSANASIAPLMFSARGDASPAGFDIDLRFSSLPTTGQLRSFAEAVARWEAIILGDLPDVSNFSLPAGSCLAPTAVQLSSLDDLSIVVRLESIDGPSNFLAFAGPCVVRGGGLTSFGVMQFDTADLPNLEARGSLRDVILHEMGHVLGVGTLWSATGFLQLPSSSTTKLDTHFNGPESILGFDAIGGATYTGAGQQVPGGAKVPVENCTNGTPTTCGSGTINAHWREGVLRSELMTGYLNTAAANPLSLLTVRSLRDLGYLVDLSAADPFQQSMGLQSGLMSADDGGQLPLLGDALALPLLEMGLDGRIIRRSSPETLRPTRRPRGGR